jgi:hypothetical protein
MSDEARARREATPEEAELARVMDLARTLWNELKECGWPMTRLGLALAEAEDRGKAAARAECEAALAYAEKRLSDLQGAYADANAEIERLRRNARAGEDDAFQHEQYEIARSQRGGRDE